MNQTVYSRRPSSSIPNVIFALLIANGLVFALQQLNAEFMFINFALWPATCLLYTSDAADESSSV